MAAPPARSSRLLKLLLLLMLWAVSFAVSSSCSKSPTAPCSSCGSGDVYWDSGVDRCRDHANGQFVKSCCCGH
jgi:hypothetical protein